jgi:hypothetical protein
VEPLALVVVDVTAVQSYVFGSNRLRENVGGSHLVHMATEGWLYEQPDALMPGPHNIIDGGRQDLLADEAPKIEDGALDYELMYAGGGNTVLLCKDRVAAERFANRLSTKMLTEAPGLDAVLVIEPFHQAESLALAMGRVMKRVAAKKQEREWSQPLLGLGVTAACQSTGLPANTTRSAPGETAGSIPLSIDSATKWEQNDAAKKRLEEVVFQGRTPVLPLPDQFEDLGRIRGDVSYMAVVHADGNGMGRILEDITTRFEGLPASRNRDFIAALRCFSDSVNGAGLEAIRITARKFEEYVSLRIGADDTPFMHHLPFRPIVFGGDDVAFVCDGRLGLWAAQVFLKGFAEQMVPDSEARMHAAQACAGIAIVKVRYPFARAYELAEQLCANAKATFKRQAVAMDWHLAQSGIFGSLREIRKRNYDETRRDGVVKHSLLMRPVTIDDGPLTGWYSWGNFTRLLAAFQDRETWPRSKTMLLREALPAGNLSVLSFVAKYGAVGLPMIPNAAGTTLPGGEDYRTTGWLDGRCVYFDPIEMIEQEVPA